MRDRHGSPPCGGASCIVSFLLAPQSPPLLPPARARVPPCAVGSRWHCATARPDDARAPPPSTGVDAARSGSAGDGAGGVWGVGSPGCRLPSVDGRGRVRPCTTASPGVRGRLAGGNVPARHGVGAGRCRRRVPMRASRRGSRGAAEAHASGARLAGPEGVEGGGGGRACATGGQGVPARSVRPGRGPAPGQPGEGLPERFSVGAGFAATAPDLLPGAAGPGLDAPPPRGPVRPTAPAPPPGPHTPARSCTPAPRRAATCLRPLTAAVAAVAPAPQTPEPKANGACWAASYLEKDNSIAPSRCRLPACYPYHMKSTPGPLADPCIHSVRPR